MRELAAKKLTGLANNWLSQDEENLRNPETSFLIDVGDVKVLFNELPKDLNIQIGRAHV